MSDQARSLADGTRLAGVGTVVNLGLVLVKGVAGIAGHSQALVADAVESLGDVLASVVVWVGLRQSARSADDNHPYGHGKAESLAAAITGLILWGGATLISWHAVLGIRERRATPHIATLVVLAGVILLKAWLTRRTQAAALASGSRAVEADAWHHQADAWTSAVAFIGIGIALLGGESWAWTDSVAALLGAGIIGLNGWRILSPAVHDLMDGAPPASLVDACTSAAAAVPGVLLIEKLKARRVGARYFLDMHVQADSTMSLHEAHILSGCVKSAIRAAVPTVADVLVHMEPFEPAAVS